MAKTKRRNPLMRANKKKTDRKKKRMRKRTMRLKPSTKIPIVYGRIHATWCGHCTAMEPAWKKIEKQNKLKPSAPVLFDIESEEKDKMNEFVQTYQITLTHNGYPTIYKLYEKGGPVEYYESGDRSEAAIRKWLFSRPKHM
jgi:thiol-disulfide isomerase/thioredoxin